MSLNADPSVGMPCETTLHLLNALSVKHIMMWVGFSLSASVNRAYDCVMSRVDTLTENQPLFMCCQCNLDIFINQNV